jgi:hypothetical protein
MKRFAALALVALVGCGGLGDRSARPGGGGPDAPVTSTPIDPNSPIPSPKPKLVKPQQGLLDIRPQPWDDARPTGSRTVLMTFYAGTTECYGVDRVDVGYGSNAVTLTLFVGRMRGNQICIEIAEYQAVRVSLDEPLDGRKVLDGAL